MIMEAAMDSSAGSVSDRSSNVSSTSPPPKSAVTPPSIGGHSSPGLTGRLSQNSPIMAPHQLSPPHVSTPNTLVSRLGHSGLPPLPPTLGLLNSLSNMVHHSPLDLMSVSHHHVPPRSYNSPPPIPSTDPTANECKLVEYRGQKVAAFIIQGDTMLCLPQAFELFLKHLVGGLHTVYTKLKRLDIIPLVCNVEQVRILRGLGAIQPGVNRCKLLSCKDFDILYRDCTTARCMMSHKATDSNALLFRSSRPGRPPKRASSVGMSIAASHLSQLKKHRENGDYLNAAYENGHINDISRLEKSPLLANGYNHPPTHLNHMQQFMQFNHHPAATAAALLNHHGLPPSHPHSAIPRLPHQAAQSLPPATMDALTRSGFYENYRAAYEDIVKHLERLRDGRSDVERAISMEHKARDLSSRSSDGHSPVLNLSKGGGDHSGSEGGQTAVEDVDDDVDNSMTDGDDDEDDKDQDLSDNGDLVGGNSSGQGSDTPPQTGALNYSSGPNCSTSVAVPSQQEEHGPTISSTETLLRNIQGLLKVAADNARQQERQINYQNAELKMDILREREVKEGLQRQLVDEQKIRVLYQKRLKKEKRIRRRVQDQLDVEIKRRIQIEEAIKTTASNADALRILYDYEKERDKEKEREREREKEKCNTESTDANGYNNNNNNNNNNNSQNADSAAGVEKTSPAWNYANLDLMNPALWHNYTEFTQEMEMDRKNKQVQHVVKEEKSPIQDSRSSNYYKNSVLFGTTT